MESGVGREEGNRDDVRDPKDGIKGTGNLRSVWTALYNIQKGKNRYKSYTLGLGNRLFINLA